jgi:hypothetical protein
MKKCKQWKDEKVKIRRITMCVEKKGRSMAMATNLNMNNTIKEEENWHLHKMNREIKNKI